MDNKPSHNTLELALQSLIAARCKRAYLHDLRNGLQGVYGSFEVIKRLLASSPSTAPPPAVEKSIDMFRRSIGNYEVALKHTVDNLIPEAQDRTTVGVGDMLHSVAAFLNGDAAGRDVSLRVTAASNLEIVAKPQALRLTLLSVLLDSIDMMPQGGETRLDARASDGHVVIEITATPTTGSIGRNIATAWDLNLSSDPPYSGLVYPVARNLVRADEGTIELAKHNDGLRVSLTYPAANSN